MAGRNGMGPMTGRGFGPCGNGYSYGTRFGRRPEYGLGLGRRRYGYSNPYLYEPYPIDESMEKDFLEKEKASLKSRLKEINSVLDKMEKED